MPVATVRLDSRQRDWDFPGFVDGCFRIVARRWRPKYCDFDVIDVRLETVDSPPRQDAESVPVPIESVTVTLRLDREDAPALP